MIIKEIVDGATRINVHDDCIVSEEEKTALLEEIKRICTMNYIKNLDKKQK